MHKVKLNRIKLIDIAVVLVGIAMAILTFIRIPFAFILGYILLLLVGAYLLACTGLFDDEEAENME